MINFSASKVYETIERPVLAGQTVSQEGCAIIDGHAGGAYGVGMSAGAAGEKFVGVSVNMLKTVTRMPNVERAVQPVSNTIQLSFTPLGGSLRVYDETTGTDITANATPSGSVITMTAPSVGHTLAIFYAYSPTTIQATQMFGNVHPGGAAGDFLAQIGIVRRGDVFTSEYDTASDWGDNATPVKLGANGLFTKAGSGVNISEWVTVISAPTPGQAFLGLSVTA